MPTIGAKVKLFVAFKEKPRHFKLQSISLSADLRGKACLGFSLPQTPLMWEPPALGLPLLVHTNQYIGT